MKTGETTCSIEGCGVMAEIKGFCRNHYRKYREQKLKEEKKKLDIKVEIE